MVGGQTHAVVMGASVAGLLAASALVRHVDAVTVVERDRLPSGPQPRRGVPQACHTHLLLSSGLRSFEALVPSIWDRLREAGANRAPLSTGAVLLSSQGWLRRFPGDQFLVTCSRNLLEYVLRAEILRQDRITVAQGCLAEGLRGGNARVDAVVVRDEATGERRELEADFVVDATGRASRAGAWLDRLGYPKAREDVLDPGLAYVTRVFRAPPGAATSFPVVNVMADPSSGEPGRAVTLAPIEHGRWMVTLGGTRGAEPPTTEDGFARFARTAVRHPIVADLIEHAEPLGPVRSSRSTVNRRYRFDRLPRWPANLVVMGDALAAFNPVYGQGMTVAARAALVLNAGLSHDGLGANAAHRIQRVIGRATDDAWNLACGQDMWFPGALERRPSQWARLQQRYIDRVMKTATSEPDVAEIVFDVFSLSRPVTAFANPKVALAALRGPGQPPLDEPPLTPEEWSRVVSGPEDSVVPKERR
ncbi:hypothetical protein GCM10012275_57310 [Longimycelium tulufanense]|uniref:FAD-binding domain-containing protein n=1 Tax=Longimycelium tulufanense TaxID=907463 RepID=A0A8J3CI54_9PSEU|nr:FAD-dependent monooxygenase [Longimycelium tulufanense]GGM79259.1 hypothetical protein GCM10012275_57310 [Longimycelium tulufanense]